jgi:alkylation response protein AidB-like acyl-CoA dehydrogenase
VDFSVEEERQSLRKAVRDFVEREIPREMVRELDENREMPLELFQKIANQGWLGITIPEELGGSGGDYIDLAIVIEELSRRMAALAFIVAAPVFMCGASIGRYGTAEQKQFYLPRMISGEDRWCIALTEPGGGTDVFSMKTKATQRDDASWVINGSKMFITGAHLATKMLAVVRTHPSETRGQGYSMLIVDPAASGVTINHVKTVGLRAVRTNEVVFDNVVVPSANILGEPGNAWRDLTVTLNAERVIIAAMAVGVAQAAFEDALLYAKQRVVFDKPIGQFQTVQHWLADMAMQIDAARTLCHKAGWLYSKGEPCALEAASAKLYASEVAERTAHNGMQLMGGHGFTMDFDMQRYWRDARLFGFAPLNNEHIRNMVGESLGLPRSF